MYIAVDFDGTVVTHMYPDLGNEIPNVENVLKKLVDKNHKLILYTMRSGITLEDAINWYKEKNIPLYAINDNPSQNIWTSSRKIYANLYIDDASLGIPVIYDEKSERNRVDWYLVEKMLIKRKIL